MKSGKELTKVYVTKYTLTKGILEYDARIVNENMVEVKTGMYSNYFHGNDYFFSLEEARVNANNRVFEKLKSLNKQIIKISKLNF